ncbi:MAG: hypothetical protein U0M66_07035 [Bacilli bacterium]|nr:hypothetical protein [Bacilli bacterium]
MYLTDIDIIEMVNNNGLIENFNKENLGCISYDLTVSKIILPETSGEQSSYNLMPNETIFIASEENIKLPNNCLGIITLRNACIRMGLDIASPVYHPGHHTKIFTRITNISNGEITINSGMSIVSIMFCKLNKDVLTPYNGTYTNEFNYQGIGKFHKVDIPKTTNSN